MKSIDNPKISALAQDFFQTQQIKTPFLQYRKDPSRDSEIRYVGTDFQHFPLCSNGISGFKICHVSRLIGTTKKRIHQPNIYHRYYQYCRKKKETRKATPTS